MAGLIVHVERGQTLDTLQSGSNCTYIDVTVRITAGSLSRREPGYSHPKFASILHQGMEPVPVPD